MNVKDVSNVNEQCDSCCEKIQDSHDVGFDNSLCIIDVGKANSQSHT